MFEVEIKFRVDNEHKILSSLKALGMHFSSVSAQKDVIFVSSDTIGFNIKMGTPVVRIRFESNSTRLTLKKKVSTDCSIEHELLVHDGIEMMHILENIGLKKIVEVEKNRSIAEYKNMTYCLDNVKGIGTFLEIEIIVEKEEDVGTARTTIMRSASEIGLDENDIENKKYDTLVYESEM